MSQTGLDHQKKYFRSLSQLENTPEFEQFLHREFPLAASEFPEGVSRRRWLQLMGASLAFAGVSGCRYGREEIAAYVVRPEGQNPGIANYFATNFEWAGRAMHLLATNMDGRPIKLDGNPSHPLYAGSESTDFKDGNEKKFASAGSDVFTQACVLSLYDPDRLSQVVHRDAGKVENSTWELFETAAAASLKELEAVGGKGLAVLFEPTRSPSLQRRLAEVKTKLPQATLVEYASIDRSSQSAAVLAAGGKGEIQYKLDSAKVIADLDADLLGVDPAAALHARQFAKGRTPSVGEMNRLYCVESKYSVTGGAADFRQALPSSQIPAFVAKLESAVDAAIAGHPISAGGDTEYSKLVDAKSKVDRTIEVLSGDLAAHKGTSLVAIGAHHAAEVQQAVLRINARLGNIGKTLLLLDVPNDLANIERLDIQSFAAKAVAGEFTNAWVLAPNPVFTSAGDANVASALEKIKSTVYLGDYDDETAAVVAWTVPAAHPLESWGDVRGIDGSYSVCQPQILPLLNGRTAIEVLGVLAGLEERSGQALVRATANRVAGAELGERGWKQLLHQGFLADSNSKLASGSISTNGSLPGGEIDPDRIEQGKLEVVFYPSDSVYDGRLANNGWLQELPQPVTKLVWDNAAVVSPKTARSLSLKQGEMVRLAKGSASVELPVFVVPGHADGSIAVQLGYGRTKAGTVGTNVGHSVTSLRGSTKSWILQGVEARTTTRPYKLATTQDHFSIDEGGLKEIAKRSPTLVREGTLDQYNANVKFSAIHPHFPIESLWKEPAVDQVHAWAMSIDLNKCIGCNACVIACQAENNVPIVGKEQVSRGREMHWLRIDRYFQCDFERTDTESEFSNPIDAKIVSQPVACAHCETAPCEQVCPVAATVHTEEGINAMAYNRCIGTRYCANNCPYKVRRFNYFNFNTKYGYHYGWTTDKRETVNTKLQSLVLNPDVTVRGRGVMEKCTYCIQRVQNGKIKARTTGDGKVHDGDIKSACQEACPTQAIVFGDLNDKNSRVYKLHHDPRSYGMLEELNIKPRTLYLTRLRNVPKRLMTSDQLHPKASEPHHGPEGSDDSHSVQPHTAEEHAK